jgi:hypothetical protein
MTNVKWWWARGARQLSLSEKEARSASAIGHLSFSRIIHEDVRE